MIVAHSNLMEHFYFGLAYIYGKETDTFKNVESVSDSFTDTPSE